jgi:hypothetical protein
MKRVNNRVNLTARSSAVLRGKVIGAAGYPKRWLNAKMSKWRPTSQKKLEAIIREQFAECTPEQRETFEKYRVPMRRVDIQRYGKTEHVFVVAQRGLEAMYYEDVEEGFNFSPLDTDGNILEHWCNQDELKYALLHWMGLPQQYALGPAEPIDTE